MKKGKKIIFLLLTISVLGTTVMGAVSSFNNLTVSTAANAGWDDCSKGLHCTTKKRCGKYVDSNKDGACDHGQTKSDKISKSVASISTEKASNTKSPCDGNCAACGACA